MITVTEKAAEQLKTIIADQGMEGKSLRVFAEAGGCAGVRYGMGFDDKQADDQVVTHEGIEVVIDPASVAMMAGSVIDYIQTARGEGFQIRNPNAPSCGSGCDCSGSH